MPLRSVLLPATLSLALAALPTAAEIEALDKAWSQAIVKADAAALDKLLADDLIYAHSTGVVDTKASYIAKIKSGKQVYKSFEIRNFTIKLHGDSAVSHCWGRSIGTNQNGAFDDKLMLIHFWVKGGSGWKLAAHQTTRVEKVAW